MAAVKETLVCNILNFGKDGRIMAELKPKEQRVLDYLRQKTESQGFPPSVREICKDLSMKSTSTAHMYLERLEAKGCISRRDGSSRSIILLEDALTSESDNEGAKHSYKVPLLGQVAAGTPILTAENFDGYLTFSTEKSYDRDSLFALNVKGESMIEAGILNGDIVVVEKRNYADNGEIVVAMIEDEATVKRFYKENGMYRLQPENSTMAPIMAKEVSILGKVVADIRYY